MKISELFDVSYGNKLDYNKMTACSKLHRASVNFVSRTSKNNGVVGIVKKIDSIKPFDAGMITVSLGGSYVLSSFIQQKPFYTAQNIIVLSPKVKMTINEKIYYCMCITKNRFRYSAFGREANRTLKDIIIPDSTPSWVNKIKLDIFKDLKDSCLHGNIFDYSSFNNFKEFKYIDLFYLKTNHSKQVNKSLEGNTPLVSATVNNNSIVKYINEKPDYEGNIITVIKNGNGTGEAFYQSSPFCITTDVIVLEPKFKLNIYIAMFIITLIRKEKYRYSYGRKWTLERMKKDIIKLPVDNTGNPCWESIEKYIKNLEWSKGLL